MDLFDAAERAMAMDDATWARHANPLSGYTRIAGGSALFFALYAAHWIGWWAVLPVALAVGWLVVNPRAFPPPATAEAWMTKGVLGERVFLNRKTVAIPKGFVTANWVTTAFALGFAGLAVWGLVAQDFWFAFTAWHAAAVAKLWFVDRCVWLFEIMKDRHPAYTAWANGDFAASVRREL